MSIRSRQTVRGFTLMEVLIALAVLAIGMIAVIGTAGTSTRLAAELKDETFAHWVAMNELTRLRLAASWPDVGTQKGEADMAGQQWHWQATISTTSDPDLLRADIDVSNALAPDTVVSSLTGFIGRPQQLPVTGPVQPVINSPPARP
ncbi:MAG TPA: type II secretion system minor pseudopilin GspI [Gammaproteobacteria bacterium]|nr:type II secretion system minor pseudopilin GspI [Gammaproteobacteria bacterium]